MPIRTAIPVQSDEGRRAAGAVQRHDVDDRAAVDRAVDVRVGVVAHGLDAQLGVGQPGGVDGQQDQVLAEPAVVAVEDARHLVAARGVDEALLRELTPTVEVV